MRLVAPSALHSALSRVGLLGTASMLHRRDRQGDLEEQASDYVLDAFEDG